MSEPVEMHGFVSAKRKVHTLKDLREFVAWCDKYRVDGDCNVDYGTGGDMYIDLISGLDVLPASWIECGDHMWDDIQYDVLIETHAHPERDEDDEDELSCDKCGKPDADGSYHRVVNKFYCVPCYQKQAPDTYEEALEQALDRPAKYDWPSIDRYGAESRPE